MQSHAAPLAALLRVTGCGELRARAARGKRRAGDTRRLSSPVSAMRSESRADAPQPVSEFAFQRLIRGKHPIPCPVVLRRFLQLAQVLQQARQIVSRFQSTGIGCAGALVEMPGVSVFPLRLLQVAQLRQLPTTPLRSSQTKPLSRRLP